MIKKFIGYVLSMVGIIIIAVGTLKPVRSSISFIPPGIKDTYIIIIGLILVLIGIFLSYTGSSSAQKSAEVPIYHGKDVVGFRRLGKK